MLPTRVRPPQVGNNTETKEIIMRITRNLFLGLFSCLAALVLGVATAGATHGNATWDCVNNTPVLNVTVLGSTVWDGFNTATYKIKDSLEDPKQVTRDALGVMPNVEFRINNGDVILGTYEPGGPRNSNVPYLITGEKPDCVVTTTTPATTVPTDSTTSTPGKDTTTSSEAPPQSSIPTDSSGVETSDTLPPTGSDGWKKVLATALICLIVGCMVVFTIWYVRRVPKSHG